MDERVKREFFVYCAAPEWYQLYVQGNLFGLVSLPDLLSRTSNLWLNIVLPDTLLCSKRFHTLPLFLGLESGVNPQRRRLGRVLPS